MLQKNPSFNRRCEKLAKIQKQVKSGTIVSENYFCGQSTIHNAGQPSIQYSEAGFNMDLKSDLRTMSAHKVVMPKLVLSGAKDESSSSSDQYDPHNKAVDSNKTIVVAYYCRKLLMKVLSAFDIYHEEQNAKVFLKEAVTQNYRRMLLRIHFKHLRKHLEQHRGHYRSKLLAEAFFRAKVGKVYFKFWRNQMFLSLELTEKLTIANSALNTLKR